MRSRNEGVKCILSGALCLLGALLACRPAAVVITDTVYLELHSLAAQPDERHVIPIRETGGKTWYREQVPAFNLADFRPSTAKLISQDHSYGLFIYFAQHAQWRAHEWSSARIGQHAGVVVGEKLISVEEIKNPIHSSIGFVGFQNEQEASTAVTILRAGGRPSHDAPATQPASSRAAVQSTPTSD